LRPRNGDFEFIHINGSCFSIEISLSNTHSHGGTAPLKTNNSSASFELQKVPEICYI
jgi:hypothetical protein